MDYWERKNIISRCMQKLPYPETFYQGLSDGSLWNVYNKHIVQGIPIDRRKKEKKQKKNTYPEGMHQISMEEYMETMQPKQPAIVEKDGLYYRLNDSGQYDWIPDSELQDTLETFNQDSQEQGRSLVLKRGKQIYQR